MNKKRRGRIGQTLIYTGKMFRLFIHEGEWKNLLFAGIISLILTYSAGKGSFVSKEDTRVIIFCIVSACIWVGIFNSIQTICRERKIIKQEHRSGLHITSYVMAHMIKQFVLCLLEAVIMFAVYHFRLPLPEAGLITGNFRIDFFVTLFLLTYASAMLGLVVSSIVRTTTAAMTVMPFLLIVQLIFSGAIFQMRGDVMTFVSDLTISRWGMRAICTDANLNDMPSTEITYSLKMFVKYLPDTQTILEGTAEYQQIAANNEEIAVYIVSQLPSPQEIYESIPPEDISEYAKKATFEKIYTYDRDMVVSYWRTLALFIAAYYCIAVISLEFVDHDKR